MQVDPIKPSLKAPEAQHSKLKYDELHSDFAFKFNLRHCIQEREAEAAIYSARLYETEQHQSDWSGPASFTPRPPKVDPRSIPG